MRKRTIPLQNVSPNMYAEGSIWLESVQELLKALRMFGLEKTRQREDQGLSSNILRTIP